MRCRSCLSRAFAGVLLVAVRLTDCSTVRLTDDARVVDPAKNVGRLVAHARVSRIQREVESSVGVLL